MNKHVSVYLLTNATCSSPSAFLLGAQLCLLFSFPVGDCGGGMSQGVQAVQIYAVINVLTHIEVIILSPSLSYRVLLLVCSGQWSTSLSLDWLKGR